VKPFDILLESWFCFLKLCEEHRESGILKRGHLAPREKDDGTEIEKRTYTDPGISSRDIM
jgi:hypothetical protein